MLTISNPERYSAGEYLRLSNERIETINGETSIINDDERESGSIANQKVFLTNFCKENRIKVHKIYKDDGVSGATFERPRF